MFGLGPTELIVILVLGLLVLGPERIPGVASSLGKAIRSFRRATRDLRDQIDLEDDVRRPFEDLRVALRDEPPPPPPFMSPSIAPPLDPPVAAPDAGIDSPAPLATLTPPPGVSSLVAASADAAGDDRVETPGGIATSSVDSSAGAAPHEPPVLSGASAEATK